MGQGPSKQPGPIPLEKKMAYDDFFGVFWEVFLGPFKFGFIKYAFFFFTFIIGYML
jgi:hypothetical protein